MAGASGTSVYTREGTTSRMMAADRPYGEFYGFYSASPEYFGETLVNVHTDRYRGTYACAQIYVHPQPAALH
jgi:hypothetical protein